MRPPENFIGQPIRSLKTMLRVIAENDSQYDRLVPDSIYGPETRQAVSTFQRNHGLAVTGVTDQQTWEEIVAAYELALIEQDQAEPLQVIFNPGQIYRKGERHPNILLAQGILYLLSETYGSIGQPRLTGILDDLTEDSLASFQILSALPMTGQLDKHTWKHLALQFSLASNLSTHLD